MGEGFSLGTNLFNNVNINKLRVLTCYDSEVVIVRFIHDLFPTKVTIDADYSTKITSTSKRR